MGIRNFSFMKINRNRQYGYEPRYYNEQKERLKARIEKYQRENENDSNTLDEKIRLEQLRDEISQNWVRGDEYKKSIFQSNIRLIIILAIILGLVYFIFSGLEIGGTYIEQLKTK